MTDCDGRCRSGRAFGQGFNSPQVHTFLPFIRVKVRQHVIFLKVSGAFFFVFLCPGDFPDDFQCGFRRCQFGNIEPWPENVFEGFS